MISHRLNAITPSGSVMLAQKVSELRSMGREIISLSVGEPDFETPSEIIEATKMALDKGQTRYSFVHGIPELRSALSEKLLQDNKIETGPENIMISHGSKQSLYNIFQVLLNQGDEVIVLKPYWVTFPETIKLAGGVPVYVECSNLQPDIELIRRAITKKTKAIIINSPNNPSGAVFSKSSLEEIGELVLQHNLTLVSDEAYESFTYGDNQHHSPASFSKELYEKTLTVQSFSKTYCMTGFRIGYVTGPRSYILPLIKLQSHLTGNNSVFTQMGALKALQMPQDFFIEMKNTFERRRNLAFDLFKDVLDLESPQGAFYLFGKMPQKLTEKYQNDENLAFSLLENAGVALLPGTFFGLPHYLRISFAASEKDLSQAAKKIKEVL